MRTTLTRDPNGARQAESTVTPPSLPWIASGLLAGAIALGVGAVLIVMPVRRVRGRR